MGAGTALVVAGVLFGGIVAILWDEFFFHRLKLRAADLKTFDLVHRAESLTPSKIVDVSRVLNRAQTSFKTMIAGSGILWVFGGYLPGFVAVHFDTKGTAVTVSSASTFLVAYLVGFAVIAVGYWFYRRMLFVIANLRTARTAMLSVEDITGFRNELKHLFFDFGPWTPPFFKASVADRVSADGKIAKLNSDRDDLQDEIVDLTENIAKLKDEVLAANFKCDKIVRFAKRSEKRGEVLGELLGFVSTFAQRRALQDSDKLLAANIDQLCERIQGILKTVVDSLKCVRVGHAVFYCFSTARQVVEGLPVAVSRKR